MGGTEKDIEVGTTRGWDALSEMAKNLEIKDTKEAESKMLKH